MIRISLVIWLIVAAAVAVGLYQVKYEVQRLEGELDQVRGEIREHQRALHVLDAEWSYLNRPSRLARLAEEHLGLEPQSPKQVVRLEYIPPRVTNPIPAAASDTEAVGLDGIPLPRSKPWSLRPQLAGRSSSPGNGVLR